VWSAGLKRIARELFGGQFADPIEDPVSDHGYNGVHDKNGNLHANDRAER
jgi:hypothetical protein